MGAERARRLAPRSSNLDHSFPWNCHCNSPSTTMAILLWWWRLMVLSKANDALYQFPRPSSTRATNKVVKMAAPPAPANLRQDSIESAINNIATKAIVSTDVLATTCLVFSSIHLLIHPSLVAANSIVHGDRNGDDEDDGDTVRRGA